MVSDAEYRAVVEFLYKEARLADEARYADWLALWTDDGVYWVPATTDPGADPDKHLSHIYDNRGRLETRIKLLQTGHRYSQEPASLMRRLISNIEVAAADDGEHLEGRQGGFVQLLEPAHDPVAQLLGNSLEGGSREVTALFDDCPNQPQGKERIPARARKEPIGEYRRRFALQHAGSQLADLVAAEATQLLPREDAILLEAEQHVVGDRMLAELRRPCGQDDEDAARTEVAGQLAERLERRGIGKMDVVEDDDNRRFLGKVAQEDRKALNEPRVQCLVAGKPASDRGDAAEYAGEIVEHPAAKGADLGRGKPAQMPLEGLHPETEGGRRAERVGTGGESDDGALVAGEKLGGKPGLAHARVGQEEDAA